MKTWSDEKPNGPGIYACKRPSFYRTGMFDVREEVVDVLEVRAFAGELWARAESSLGEYRPLPEKAQWLDLIETTETNKAR